MTGKLAWIATITIAMVWSWSSFVEGSARTQQPSLEIALVANSQAATVALVDVRSRAIVGTIDVNPTRAKAEGPGAPNYAQDTDVSPDGRTLYVSRGYVGDVAAFDIASGRLLWQRSLNTGRADHMTLTPDGVHLFVSAMMDNRVYRIATATGEITGHLVTGVYPHDNKVSRDGRRLYNTSIGGLPTLPRTAGSPPLTETPGDPFQLTIADVGTLAIRDRIRLDNAIRPWQFTPDEKGLYAQLSNEHAVVAYDLAARKVIRRLELPVKPGVTKADWDFEAPHHGLAITDDGKTLCLAARASDYAALVSAPDLTLIATVPVGDAPGWAETADEGKVCLIANSRSDDLSIISIPERKEIARLPIGDGPKHITVARIPASVIAAFKVPRTPRDSAIAAVNEFFRAMTTRDTAATNRVQFVDGVSFAVRAQGDTFAISRRGNDGWIRQLATMRDTVVERMWEPVVQVHGPIATVWAPYDIHRNRQFVHCGVDAFTLIRTMTGWKIATVAYTAEPTGCAPSPLGPLR